MTDVKKQHLESALFQFSTKHPFDTILLQEFNFRFTEYYPTAALQYNKKSDTFEIHINPKYFTTLTLNHRIGLLQHEIMHFTNRHFFRADMEKLSEEDRKLWNFAGDIAINQYIPDKPETWLSPEQFKMKDPNGKLVPFPKFKIMEEYYKLLSENKEENDKMLNGSGTADTHLWEDLSEEEQQRMLQQAQGMLKRTIEKSQYGHGIAPGHLQDCLMEIEKRLITIDYKAILKRAVKKTLTVSDREGTWNRPNKRFGNVAKGTTVGKLPSLGIYIDSSGSICYDELNTFMQFLNNLIKVGSKKCTLGLWHTELYHTEKYRFNQKISKDVFQSGGTDVGCVFRHIKKSNPNLAVILTDGYYACDESDPKTNEIVWVISPNGTIDHPKKYLGKTIKMEDCL